VNGFASFEGADASFHLRLIPHDVEKRIERLCRWHEGLSVSLANGVSAHWKREFMEAI
jgi:hypothetical protein